MGHWADRARAAINRAHIQMPADIALADRIAAVDAAYPFGERANFPYKAWLEERRRYLVRYGYLPKQAEHLSPLERAMEKAKRKGVVA